MKINHNLNPAATSTTSNSDNRCPEKQPTPKSSAANRSLALPQESPQSPPLKRLCSTATQTDPATSRCPFYGVITPLISQPMATSSLSHERQRQPSQRALTINIPNTQAQPVNSFKTRRYSVAHPLSRLSATHLASSHRCVTDDAVMDCRKEAAAGLILLKRGIRPTPSVPFDVFNSLGSRVIIDQGKTLGISCPHPTPEKIETYLDLLRHTQSPLIIVLTSEVELMTTGGRFSSFFKKSDSYGAFHVVCKNEESLLLGNCLYPNGDEDACYADQYQLSVSCTNNQGHKQARELNVVHVLDWQEQDYLDYHALNELACTIRELYTLNCQRYQDGPTIVLSPNNSHRDGVLYAALQLESNTYVGQSVELKDIIQNLNQCNPQLIRSRHQISQLLDLEMFYEKVLQASLEHELRLQDLAQATGIEI